MDDRSKAIAVVHGASGPAVQDAFRSLVDRWPMLRIAGVIAEAHGLSDRACSAGYLHRLGTDERFAIFDDRGPGSTVCHLEGGGALAAAEAIRRDIAGGCDLVLLSKFGKLEAGGGGLFAAFKAAIDEGIPVLTSVSPAAAKKWESLATREFATLSADAAEIDAWIERLRYRAASGGSYDGDARPR
jgi:hypothetical protein